MRYAGTQEFAGHSYDMALALSTNLGYSLSSQNVFEQPYAGTKYEPLGTWSGLIGDLVNGVRQFSCLNSNSFHKT